MDFVFQTFLGFIAYGLWRVQTERIERSITVAVVSPPPDWLDGEVVNNRYWLPGPTEQAELRSPTQPHETAGVLRMQRCGMTGPGIARAIGLSPKQTGFELLLGMDDETDAARRGAVVYDDRIVSCSQCRDAMVKEYGSRFVCHHCGLASYKTPKQVVA